MPQTYADKLAYIIKAMPESRQIQDPFATLYGQGEIIEPPLPPERLLLLAEENAIHAACLRAKTDDSVGRGWRLTGRRAEPLEEVARQIESITPSYTFEELLNIAAWELEAIGWAAWEIVRQDGKIAAIYPLPAHTLRATRDQTLYIQIRETKQQAFPVFGTGEKNDSEVIVFRSYSPRSPYYGIPRWVSAIPAIAELTAIREFNISWFASGGTADRIISVTAPSLMEAERKAEEIQDAIRQAAGRGHVSIVMGASSEAGIDVKFLSPALDRREGQFLRRRDDLVKEVLMAHGVPPYRIGWAEVGALGGNAAREMLRAYRLGVIEPIQTILESRLNQTIFGPNGLNLSGRWVLNDVSWEETELNLKIAVDGISYGVLTPNEARRLLGWEEGDLPELDRHYLVQGVHPIEMQQDVNGALDVINEFRTAIQEAMKDDALSSEGVLGGHEEETAPLGDTQCPSPSEEDRGKPDDQALPGED